MESSRYVSHYMLFFYASKSEYRFLVHYLCSGLQLKGPGSEWIHRLRRALEDGRLDPILPREEEVASPTQRLELLQLGYTNSDGDKYDKLSSAIRQPRR
jgi:hypothetical protein